MLKLEGIRKRRSERWVLDGFPRSTSQAMNRSSAGMMRANAVVTPW